MAQTRKINIINSIMIQWRGRPDYTCCCLLTDGHSNVMCDYLHHNQLGCLIKKQARSYIFDIKSESLRDGVLKSACSTNSIYDFYGHYSLRTIRQEKNIKCHKMVDFRQKASKWTYLYVCAERLKVLTRSWQDRWKNFFLNIRRERYSVQICPLSWSRFFCHFV